MLPHHRIKPCEPLAGRHEKMKVKTSKLFLVKPNIVVVAHLASFTSLRAMYI
jgi:hypothetical protein